MNSGIDHQLNLRTDSEKVSLESNSQFMKEVVSDNPVV